MVDKKFIKYFSIFIIWLFSISGMTGILSPDYSDWFLSMSPINLLLTFIIILVNIDNFKWHIVIAVAIPFSLGFIVEALGVNYGLIFGNYSYGENLGQKFIGVPIIICVNWALLTTPFNPPLDAARCKTSTKSCCITVAIFFCLLLSIMQK